ncbi:MAG TPA: hypothetical protein VFO38_05675, partial [Candidatus Saccharimonadales bacterium]|nr:hypothetical protein [Candidatus Saccharimonadales bacterium]
MTNDEIQTKLVELERRVLVLEASRGKDAPGSTTSGAANKQLSLREFLNQKKPTTANDRGLAIAYYNETIKGYECFNAEDIKAGFHDARIPAPKNPNDVINKNIAKG